MNETTVYDGDYQIIYSNNVNLYEKKLILTNIAGFRFEICFDIAAKKEGITINGDDKNKKIEINVFNFNQVLGAATTEKVKIMNTEDGRSIYFSLYGKSLTENSPFINISITFYIK